jgi:predicted HTH transcriptional regulator
MASQMQDLTVDQLIAQLEQGRTEPNFVGVELKQSWQSRHGEDISAIANEPSLARGWLVIGLDDNGNPRQNADAAWLKKTEESVSSQIREHLSPSWSVKSIVGHTVNGAECLFIEIASPGEVVRWQDTAYNLVGTTSSPMKPHEVLDLSLKLPGADFSKAKYESKYDPSLVLQFAQKVIESTGDEFNIDTEKMSSDQILQRLNVLGMNSSGILFGEFKCRIVHFNLDGDILDQSERLGLYYILSDQFIEYIQSWTRKEGTAIRGSSASAPEELPYPVKALREILANAVAHSLYQKNQGDIVVELHPNRITVRNDCNLEAKAFVNKWFSRVHKTTNKHLMNLLRVPRITDEQGSGKIRIFRHMLESGKREPIIEFVEYGDYGRWSISLYNDEADQALINLYARIKENFSTPDECRMAQALLLWRKKNWSEILSYLDENYRLIAESVMQNRHSPVLKINDRLFTKRWASIALEGQITKQLTEAEKSSLKHVLNTVSYMSNREGFISAEDARQFIGLSNTKAEATQLARLFSEWKTKGIVKFIKKGQWQFVQKPEEKDGNGTN